jgi:peroxiredoxin
MLECIQAGVDAPDFELKDHNEKNFKLSEFRGKKVLLSFHPLAWTGICAKQMQSLERHKKEFEDLNTIAIGINVDSVPSKKAWAEVLGLHSTRLLSDFWPHGGVADKFGIFRKVDGFSERANILIDEKGKVEYVQIYEIGELPDIKEILTILRTEID